MTKEEHVEASKLDIFRNNSFQNTHETHKCDHVARSSSPIFYKNPWDLDE